jgi:hypothetical protein
MYQLVARLDSDARAAGCSDGERKDTPHEEIRNLPMSFRLDHAILAGTQVP